MEYRYVGKSAHNGNVSTNHGLECDLHVLKQKDHVQKAH